MISSVRQLSSLRKFEPFFSRESNDCPMRDKMMVMTKKLMICRLKYQSLENKDKYNQFQNFKRMSVRSFLTFLILFHCLYAQKIVMTFEVPQQEAQLSVYRQMVIQKNYKSIRDHNSDSNKTFTMKAYPQFIGLTYEEFQHQYLRNSITLAELSRIEIKTSSFKVQELLKKKPMNLKESKVGNVYSNDLSGLSPTVYDQRRCGNCYAFATVEGVNLRNRVVGRSVPNLSIEQMTSCSKYSNAAYQNMGCNGGYLSSSLYYITYYGLNSLASYPLNPVTYSTGVAQPCYSVNSARYKIPGWYNIQDSSCGDQLSFIYNKYPVITQMDFVDGLQYYQTGVVTSCPISNTVNHAVLIVGFRYDGTSSGNFFKIKNSYGPSWGENGYFRISYNRNNCNMCSYSTSVP